jgi:hypothetical protein
MMCKLIWQEILVSPSQTLDYSKEIRSTERR